VVAAERLPRPVGDDPLGVRGYRAQADRAAGNGPGREAPLLLGRGLGARGDLDRRPAGATGFGRGPGRRGSPRLPHTPGGGAPGAVDPLRELPPPPRDLCLAPRSSPDISTRGGEKYARCGGL